ncbi:MAG: NnrU family protein [Pseudomonadota bacterium]
MALLITGLILFLGTHLLRVFADDWRSQMRERWGENGWKAVYSGVSLGAFVLLVWGYSLARQSPVVLWSPPAGLRHLAAPFTWLAFVLLAAAYVPRNHFKARIHHPMVAGTKLWAFAHLLANGTLHDALLFGSFLAWAVLLFAASRRRDRKLRTVYAAGTPTGTLMAVVLGTGAWALFAFWLHGLWIGVRPFG